MTDPRDLTALVTAVPHIPSLGPTHPDEDLGRLWNDVLELNGTGAFLPHDKDRIWGGLKADQVLTDAIVTAEAAVLVPVLNQRGHGRIDAFCYGDLEAGMVAGMEAAAKLAAGHSVAAARFRWYSPAPDDRAGSAVRIHLKTFEVDAEDPLISWKALPLPNQSARVRNTFDDFADAAGGGFPFLAGQLREGTEYGPVLTIQHLGRIVGAIGPMRLQPDSRGTMRLMGQFFAVLPEHRGNGYGRDLWRTAMSWGRAAGAAYQLLQTEYDGPSDRLCQSEGLTSLGFINSLNVPL